LIPLKIIKVVTVFWIAGEKLAKLSLRKPKPPVPVVPKLVRRDSNSGMPSAHRMTISRSVMAR